MKRIWILAAALVTTSACSLGSPSQPTAAPSSSAPSASATPSATPTPNPIADCPGLTDNTNTPVEQFPADTTVYYMFACNDERVLVEMTGNQGGIAFVPLQSEYSFGQLVLANGEYSATITITSLNKVIDVPLDFSGTPTDLRVKTLVRVVGPTTDLNDFAAQDCADYKLMGIKRCPNTAAGEGSPNYFKKGEEINWINEFGT